MSLVKEEELPKPTAEACMDEAIADNGKLQICARTKDHEGHHWSRSGWLWRRA